MPTGRLKYAQDALSAISSSTQRVMPEYVADPQGFLDRVKGEVERYPSAIPWGAAGLGLGFLAGVPITRGLWRGGRAFTQSGAGQRLDDLVRQFSRTEPARFFSSKEFGLPALRPISKRTVPFAGSGLGGAWLYNIGRQRAEADMYGEAPTDRPYVYIPMQ